MKQFKHLLLIEKQQPVKKTRTLSFQSLVKHSQRYTPTTHENLERLAERIQSKPEGRDIPQTTRDRTESQPMIKLRRCVIKKPQHKQIQGVAIISSLTASSEDYHSTAIKLNTEEREEVSDKMTEIKQELKKEIMWNKRRLSLDLNGTLKDIRKELDDRTDRLMDEILAKRNNKELYLKAREQIKIYFSKKKEINPVREKTYGTPCFEETSDTKQQSTQIMGCRSFNNTMESKKRLPSTGYKLNITRKSTASSKGIKDTIVMRKIRKDQQDVYVREFKIQ